MTLPAHFTLQPLAVVLALVAGVHEVGQARMRLAVGAAFGTTGAHAPGGARRAWLARSGFLLAIAALVSPLAWYAHHDVFVRALVDIALAWVAAPVLVLGSPWVAIREAGSALHGHRAVGASTGLSASTPTSGGMPACSSPGRSSPGRPVAGVAGVLVTFWLWHVPAVLGPSVHSLVLRTCEYACYLLSGLLFWSQFDSRRLDRTTWGWLTRIGMITAVLAGMWCVAVLMVYSQAVWYPAFGNPDLGLVSPVTAQQLAGAAMWALPAIPLGIATFWCFGQWLRQDEDGPTEWRTIFPGEPSPAAPLGVGATGVPGPAGRAGTAGVRPDGSLADRRRA